MIEELEIRNLGVIAQARLPLGPGFTAVTGETGAGKTMVVTALGLILGERAEATRVRSGADNAEVDARLRLAEGTPWAESVATRVDEAGGRVEDGELLISRTVSAEGRSKASLGGRAAPVGVLAEIAEQLVVVHGQSEQLRLRSSTAQRDALDRFAGSELIALREKFRESYRSCIESGAELQRLSESHDARVREAAILREDLADIEEIAPQPGELEAIAVRIERLSNLEQLRLSATEAHEALSSETLDGTDALGLIETSRRILERSDDPELVTLAQQLAEVGFTVRDVAGSIAGYVAGLESDGPHALSVLNERRAALTGLLRKHARDSLDDVISWAEGAHTRLLELDSDDDKIEALTLEVAQSAARVRLLGKELSVARRSAAKDLAAAVTNELQALALPDATLVVDVVSVDLDEGSDTQLPSALSESGADSVSLLLAPHPGAEPRPISKSASGGELSRVMLALEVVISASDPVPTFVFDEVDAGVGGAAAIEIGRRLARLSENAQVIVVTHLAQVAAFADNHLRVEKSSDGLVTVSSIKTLQGAEREAEMARLLSGMPDSEAGLAHARELLALAR